MGGQETNSQVVWFDIPCVDIDRAIAYYNAVLGCDIEKQEFDGGAIGVLPHGGPAIGGCLALDEKHAGSNGGPLIYLNCNGRLDEAIAAAENGGEIETPRHSIGPHGFRAIIKDCEGNRIALHSE